MSGKQAKRLRSLARQTAGLTHQDKAKWFYKILKANRARVTEQGIKLKPQ